MTTELGEIQERFEAAQRELNDARKAEALAKIRTADAREAFRKARSDLDGAYRSLRWTSGRERKA